METLSLLSVKALQGGGGQASGVFVGTVTSTSTAFPTTRRDGTALQDEDYVRSGGSTFPFTLAGVTFDAAGVKAFYDSVSHIWVPDAGAVTDTSEVTVKSPSTESLSGTSATQKVINEENKNEISILGKTFSLTETDADSVRSFTLIIKDRDNHELLNKNLADFILKTRKVAGLDLADDITAQEIQDAIKELTATLKNKTIDADNNTISNIEVDNFKATAYNKKGDSLSDDDTHFATSGLIGQREISDADSSITFDTSGDTDELVFDIVNGRGETVLGKSVDFADRVVLATKTQTLTNKTINADSNTITNLEGDNFKSSAIGAGLTVASKVLKHSNSVTAQTTQNVQAIKYDAQGHITAGAARPIVTAWSATTADTNIPSEKLVKTEIDKYLPLAGGTMTGTIVSGVETGMSRDVANSALVICGGASMSDGSLLALRGGTHSTNPGSFAIKARVNSSQTVEFVGKSDGTLTWGGKNIALTDGNATLAITYTDGTSETLSLVKGV